MIHELTLLPEWIWHPLGQCVGTHAEIIRCQSYNFHSGIEGDIPLLGFFVTGLVAGWRIKKKLECHVEQPKNCHRFGHPVSGTGHRACRGHHPHAAERGSGITAGDILHHHEESDA